MMYDLEHKEILWYQRNFCQICTPSQILSIEFPETWQLSRTSYDRTFGWVSWNFYGSNHEIWLETKGNIVKSAKVLPDLHYKPNSVNRISWNLAIIKNIIRQNFWESFVKLLWPNHEIWLETQGNIVITAKFLPDLHFRPNSVNRISWNLAIIKNMIRQKFWESFVKLLWPNHEIWLETQGNIVILW